MNLNSRRYKKVPISLSKSGLITFPEYKKRKAFWIKYKVGRSCKNKNSIRVIFEGMKSIQTWHKDYWREVKTGLPIRKEAI